MPAHRLGQLAAFLVAHVSGRGSHQSGYGIFLHILGHIDPNHIPLVVKQGLSQRLGKLGFAHAGGA